MRELAGASQLRTAARMGPRLRVLALARDSEGWTRIFDLRTARTWHGPHAPCIVFGNPVATGDWSSFRENSAIFTQ